VSYCFFNFPHKEINDSKCQPIFIPYEEGFLAKDGFANTDPILVFKSIKFLFCLVFKIMYGGGGGGGDDDDTSSKTSSIPKRNSSIQ